MEIKLKVSQKDYENFEKELNKQLNAYKILENQLFELKKTKNTLDSKSLASSPNKKLKEVRTLNESNKVNSKVSEKGNFLNEDKKLDMGDKKNGNISFYSAELEYNKKITESVNLSEIDNNNSIKKFEGIVDGLKKKIAEFEKFINSGIDEGFTSKQYTKLQSNLEKIGFSPLKKKFKVDKGEKNDSENKIQTVKNNDAVNFETKSEGLNYEKNSACIHNFDISNTQKKVPSEILIGSPIKNNKTLKLVLTNSPAIEEKSEIAGELNQSKNKETELSLTKNLESSNEDRTLAKSFDIEFKNEEVKSNESKQEEKNKDIQTLFVPPTILQHSESESPSNSPLNLPPLPPPLFGSKPGLPPMLNLLNLLNKKPDGPIKEKKKPNVPMKSLLWTLVNPSNIKGTIWETIDESTVSYEIPNLENEFTSLRADKTQTISKVPAKISLIAPNRAQNLNIMLTRLKMSPSMIAEAILLINVELLNLNVVNCLLETIPNADEFSLISNYGGDLNLLESPEKYIIEVKDIKNLKVRLQAMQFYFTHKELFEDLQLKISKLIELFENISKEQRIIILMKYTLAIGNYMNGESARGGAFGFKLDAFEKIIDIKNSNGKKNLLAYIINIIEKNSGNSFIEVTDEFFLYEFGKKLPISQLFCDLELIRKGIENVKTARQNKNLGVIDNIEEILGNFETEMRNQYRNVEIDLKSLDQKYKRVCEFYCEDPKQMSSDIFVESFNKIWICCKKAKTILIKENKDNMKEIKEQKGNFIYKFF